MQNVLLSLMALAVIGWVVRTYFKSSDQKEPPIGLKGALEAVESGDRNQAELWFRTLGTVVRTESDADQAFSALVQMLKNPSSDLRAGAAGALFTVYSPIQKFAGQDTTRWKTIVQARFPDARPPLVERLGDPSTQVRVAAARTLGGLALIAGQDESLGQARLALSGVLKDPSPELQLSAAIALSDLARLSGRAPIAEEADLALIPLIAEPTVRLDALRAIRAHARFHADEPTPPQLLALADVADPTLHSEAILAAVWYRDGPELVLPFILKHLPNDNQAFVNAYRNLGQEVRFEPAVLPVLIKALENDSAPVRSFAAMALQNMGWEAQAAVPVLVREIRKRLDGPEPGPNGMPQYEELPLFTLATLAPDSRPIPEVVAIFTDVLKSRNVLHHEAAALSLGYLGRQSESALPVMISRFETAPKDGFLKGAIAFGLAGVVQGTSKEDEVIKMLGSAWTSAEGQNKQMIGRALQRFGPRAAELVPEIRDLPPDRLQRTRRPPERAPRFRYPQSR